MSQATSLFSAPLPETVNEDGYPAFTSTEERRYVQLLMCNTLSQQFYVKTERLLAESLEWHRRMAANDPAFMARALIHARQRGFMRLQPVFGLAVLSSIPDKRYFKAAFPEVILIPSDLQDFYVILQALGRGHGGRVIKTKVGEWLQDVSPYWALKYNGKGRGFSLGDILRLVRPVPRDDEVDQIFFWLTHGEVPEEGLPDQLMCFENAKAAKTPNDRAQCISKGRLPHEAVTGAFKMDPTLWSVLVPNLPLGALLRHLATLERAEILDEHKGYIIERLMNVKAVRNARLHPTAFYKAFQHVDSNWLKVSLEDAMNVSAEAVPRIPGNTAILLDTSGSMGQVITLGGIFALTLQRAAQGSRLFTFGDHVELWDAQAWNILEQASFFSANGYTDMEAPVRRLYEMDWRADNVVVITDEQQNAGDTFQAMIQKYREDRNPDLKVVVVDIMAASSAISPPNDPQTWWVYGWSDVVPAYVSQILTGGASEIDTIRGMSLEVS